VCSAVGNSCGLWVRQPQQRQVSGFPAQGVDESSCGKVVDLGLFSNHGVCFLVISTSPTPVLSTLSLLRVLPAQVRLALLWLLLSGLVGMGLYQLPAWWIVEAKFFDLATILSAPRKSMLPITIVSIDEPSFIQLGEQWPWSRTLHARLVDKLYAEGASVIAFDVMFPERSDEAADKAFAQAIENTFGAVVLAADNSYHETAMVRQWLRIDPLAEFTLAGAVTGLASVNLDSDGVVRQFPLQEDAFWRQVIRTLMSMQPGLIEEPGVPFGALINHIGPAHTFPHVSYYQVLNGDPSIPPGFFKDQIIIVGRDLRSNLEDGSSQADMFSTPFVLENGRLTAGVEIHATMVENALMGQPVVRASHWQNALLLSVLLLLALPCFAWWHVLRSGLLLIGLLGGLGGLSVWLLQQQQLWLSVSHVLIALLVFYVGMAASYYLVERRRAQGIKSAFSKYVSADVVEQMIGSKDALRLGGERKELSILFSDLAGFTSLSEALSPEEVAYLMNRYLTEMTRVIHQHNGTVDKFIGDAVMAFWGAPIDDACHALHAAQTALAMQQALAGLQEELALPAVGPLRMRIGVHSGPVVVGNMGSEERFDYTVLGDTVNLASRLEGVNKYYGTDILLSENTVAGMGDEIGVRPVDRVKVKGKAKAVHVYTPCKDDFLAKATAQAFDDYLAQDWDEAKTAWLAIQRVNPQDPLASLFLSRIDALQTHPPVDWDGATALEK
jgi:adenylate cyclase